MPKYVVRPETRHRFSNFGGFSSTRPFQQARAYFQKLMLIYMKGPRISQANPFENKYEEGYNTSMASDFSLTPAKKRLLEHLKRSGPATPTELAKAFGHSEVAMRQHLQSLAEDAWVRDQKRPAKGRGRPSMEWTLTEKSMALFPDRHGDLTVHLIEATRRAFGDEGLDKVLEIRADQQTREYRQLLDGLPSLKARVEELAEQRTREGYMAEALEAEDGGLLLVEHHCPVCEAAKSCAGLCAKELDVFRRTLGDGVSVERSRHLLKEGDRCVYRIRPADSELERTKPRIRRSEA